MEALPTGSNQVQLSKRQKLNMQKSHRDGGFGKCNWFSQQQVTVEAEVIRGEDEEEETKVNFFDIFASLRKQLLVNWLAVVLKYKIF